MIETEFGFYIGSDDILLFGSKARTVSRITYIEPDGTTIHHIPSGFVYDGASIPQIVWSIMGHPFVRPYRRASALHDYHCLHQQISSRRAHLLFYYALRADGVSHGRAWIMYKSVLWFGPRFNAKSM
jgi:hypothetical protein